MLTRRYAVHAAIALALAAATSAVAAERERPDYDRDPEAIQALLENCSRRWSPEAEEKLGRPVTEEIDRNYPPIDNPEEVARVQAIVDRLAATCDRPDVKYKVGIFSDPSPNAMSIPGGWIRVTTGLLDMVQSDDELAGVLAHEIAHNTLYHGFRQTDEDKKWGIAQLASVAAVVLGQVGGISDSSGALGGLPVLVAAARMGWLAGYSRKYEHEADWHGMRYQQAAGYDPSGFYTFMRRMMNWESSEGARRLPDEFHGWDTHPATQTRVLEVQQYFDENHIILNIARVCRGFVAVAQEVEVGEGRRVWQVAFGDRVIFQPAPLTEDGRTAEKRATDIAARINSITSRHGIRPSAVTNGGGSSAPWVGLDNLSVISVLPEDASFVGLSQSEYSAQVARSFREAIYRADQIAMRP